MNNALQLRKAIRACQTLPSNRSTASVSGCRRWIIPYIALFTLLLQGSPSSAQETKPLPAYSSELIECCFKGPTYERRGGLYKFKEPIHLFFANPARLKPSDMNQTLTAFFSRLSTDAHIETSILPNIPWEYHIDSPLIFVALPTNERDITEQQRLSITRLLVKIFQRTADFPITQKYTDIALESIYSTDKTDGAFFMTHESSPSAEASRDAAVVLARMPPDLTDQIFKIEVSVFQALDYNPDARSIEGTIFSGKNPSATAKDFAILGEIYSDKNKNLLTLKP